MLPKIFLLGLVILPKVSLKLFKTVINLAVVLIDTYSCQNNYDCNGHT
jgi:hypothetical protein